MSALPVQIITVEEIRRAGWTSVAERLAQVPASFNGRNDQLSVGGWLYASKFLEALGSGLVNPWGPFGADGQALLEAAQALGRVRNARGTLDQFDSTFAGEVAQLPAGTLTVALGAEARREKLVDEPAAIFAAGDVMSYASSIDAQSSSRHVQAAFAEAIVPIVESVEAQLSARQDRYSDFGGMTNPKVALRWRRTGRTQSLRPRPPVHQRDRLPRGLRSRVRRPARAHLLRTRFACIPLTTG